MSDIMQVENGLQNDNTYLVDNQSMVIDVLFDRMTGNTLVVSGLGLKVFLGILLLKMETIGNYLLFCMVWYEKNGMDSKKRTITNQLLTRMVLALILFYILVVVRWCTKDSWTVGLRVNMHKLMHDSGK